MIDTIDEITGLFEVDDALTEEWTDLKRQWAEYKQ